MFTSEGDLPDIVTGARVQCRSQGLQASGSSVTPFSLSRTEVVPCSSSHRSWSLGQPNSCVRHLRTFMHSLSMWLHGLLSLADQQHVCREQQMQTR